MALAKCEHPGCACLPTDGDQFCNDHCREVQFNEPKDEGGCSCGHTGCEPQTARRDASFKDDLLTDKFEEKVAEPRH